MKKTMFGWMAVLACLAWVNVGARTTAAPEVVCRVETDRGVLSAERPERTVVKVTLDAPVVPDVRERPPVNLCIVLDRSGSMSGDKIERAKEAAITALRRLGRDDVFSLVVYDHEVETLVPAQSAENVEWIEGRIHSIRSRGNTALFAGVSQGAAEIRKNLDDRYVSRIILLSDGLANVGPSSPADLGRLGASLRKERVSVTTVGVGTDYNEDLMTQLSQQSDGNSYFVENSGDLPRIFAAELGDVLSVVAREVRIIIECAGDVKPVRIIGRDGRISGRKVELNLNQLYGGQEKFVLLEVDVPPTAEGKARELAVARCEYENLITRKRASSSGRTSVTFSRTEEDVRASVNVPVQKEITLNIAAEARDEAVREIDLGRTDDAASRLRAQGMKMRQAADMYHAPELREEADKLDTEAEQVEKKVAPAATRKSLRTWSFQRYNQQESK